jgi:hypothetical protein
LQFKFRKSETILKAFDQIDSEIWKNSIKHCKEIEEKYWEIDGIIDSHIENFTIDFGEDSESENGSDFSFSDYDIK